SRDQVPAGQFQPGGDGQHLCQSSVAAQRRAEMPHLLVDGKSADLHGPYLSTVLIAQVPTGSEDVRQRGSIEMRTISSYVARTCLSNSATRVWSPAQPSNGCPP